MYTKYIQTNEAKSNASELILDVTNGDNFCTRHTNYDNNYTNVLDTQVHHNNPLLTLIVWVQAKFWASYPHCCETKTQIRCAATALLIS